MSAIDQGEIVQTIFESKSALQDKGLEQVKLELRLGLELELEQGHCG